MSRFSSPNSASYVQCNENKLLHQQALFCKSGFFSFEIKKKLKKFNSLMLSNKQFDIIYLFEDEISLYSVKNYPSV